MDSSADVVMPTKEVKFEHLFIFQTKEQTSKLFSKLKRIPNVKLWQLDHPLVAGYGKGHEFCTEVNSVSKSKVILK